MNILLINANPVVSRLLALCTRDDTVSLNEVLTVDDVQENDYNVVFVDESSYGRNVVAFIERLKSVKKVFISYRDEEVDGFDVTIKKPFLPSQITEIITGIDRYKKEDKPKLEDKTLVIEAETINEDTPSIFPLSSEEECEVDTLEEDNTSAVLDTDEIEKIKALLEIDDNLEEQEIALSDEEIEARKVEVIKEQLIADGLEIVDENEIVEELSISLDGTLNSVKKSKKKKSKKKTKVKKLKFTDEILETIEDAVEVAMASMTKKQMKKLLKGKEIEVTIKLKDEH